jgi:uroporphyrinogen-III decarboxylase
LPESYCSATTEHLVKGPGDLPALRYLYEHTFYEPDYALAARRYDLVGDHGLVLCYLPKTPFMELVALRAGIQTVTYLLADARDEMEETLAVMTRKHDEAAQIALDSPAECLMIPENLSSESVGKRLYGRYVRPYEARWIERIRAAGKYSFIHIDGTLRGLMREVSQTGFDVLEAVTPEPSGDIPVEELHCWAEPGTVIWGGLPGVMFSDLVSDAEFDAFVARALAVFRSAPRYVLGVADQVPPLARRERIARVAELVELHGRYP